MRGPVDAPRILSVGELTSHLKRLLDGDSLLADVWVRGEISNFHHHTSSGHMYFTLKDAAAKEAVSQIRTVMFRGANQRLGGWVPKDGDRVVANGNVTVYDRDGQYQFYVREMQPDGVGALYLAFEQLKRKLAEEGLFDQAVKRDLPLLPRRVGVVTSPGGAALRDIVTVARRRFPNVHIVISPVQVQGLGAAEDIIRGLQLLDARDDIDVIILARGGGAVEELWAFNDETLARVIRSTRHAVVTGVGHETDVTIADLVADKRAATPSNAAEMAVPDKAELARRTGILAGRLERACRSGLDRKRREAENLSGSTVLAHPGRGILDGRRQGVDQLAVRLEGRFRGLVRQAGLHFQGLAGRLEALSPLAILGRGYALCLRPDGSLIRTVTAVAAGDSVEVRVRDGLIDCEVVGARPDDGPVVRTGRGE